MKVVSYLTNQRNNDNNDLDEASCKFAGMSSDYVKNDLNNRMAKTQPIIDELKQPYSTIFGLNE